MNLYKYQIDGLNAKLAVQKIELKQKNEDAGKLIQVVKTETDKVNKEKAVAVEEELKVQDIAKVNLWPLFFFKNLVTNMNNFNNTSVSLVHICKVYQFSSIFWKQNWEVLIMLQTTFYLFVECR